MSAGSLTAEVSIKITAAAPALTPKANHTATIITKAASLTTQVNIKITPATNDYQLVAKNVKPNSSDHNLTTTSEGKFNLTFDSNLRNQPNCSSDIAIYKIIELLTPRVYWYSRGSVSIELSSMLTANVTIHK